MSDVRNRVIAAILGVTRPERPDLSDHNKPLLADALDSLDFASVLMALEDEFGLTLAEEKIDNIGTIEQLVAYIKKNRKV